MPAAYFINSNVMYKMDNEFIKELHSEGFSSVLIADLFGVHKSVVRRVFKKSNLSTKIKNTEDDFWIQVKKINGGCWIWEGGLNNKGYGQFSFNGKPWFSHRFAYTITNGEIPSGAFLCHKCDTPLCCNPDHLFIGDRSLNMIDMVLKGRRSNQVLDAEKVKKIKTLKLAMSPSKIAKEMSLPVRLVKKVVYNENWKHVI